MALSQPMRFKTKTNHASLARIFPRLTRLYCSSDWLIVLIASVVTDQSNGPFADSGHMVHDGGQPTHWDIQNKATSSR